MEFLTNSLLSQLPFYDEIQPYIKHLLPYISYGINTTTYLSTSVLLPLINAILAVLTTSSTSDLLTTAPIAIAILVCSLYFLGWVKRQIFFWIGLLFQLLFYAAVALAGLAIWAVGPQRCVELLSAWYQELAAAKGATAEATGLGRGRAAADRLRGKGSGYAMDSGRAGTGWR